MQVEPDTAVRATPQASIPLADRLLDFADHHVCVDHLRGHREFVFAKDAELLRRY